MRSNGPHEHGNIEDKRTLVQDKCTQYVRVGGRYLPKGRPKRTRLKPVEVPTFAG